ncbi:hypothetical protein GCM10007415_00180 [Parapedobacter pyrenivorans]|uniref:Uncharacterized protein n=1 Tax=Parapedobacter pyrenivorans TaxID=1305674 RepID=A0A917HAG6_9SPHI|nr:hypothetical protein [Parapedobacter pyrenivorans]GGG72850.1 hypothetical protein GCM10007415_00180 [Parapedobacter pyrenivorans]
MKKMTFNYLTGLLLAVLMVSAFSGCQNERAAVWYYGDEQGDLLQVLRSSGVAIQPSETPADAIESAPEGSSVLLLARTYPALDPTLEITGELLTKIQQKQLRVFVEYPSTFAGLSIPDTATSTQLERGVITAPIFGNQLDTGAIIGIHGSHVLAVEADNPSVVLARVVGMDHAEFGLANTKTYPVLFEESGVMVATTGLSHFITGRYGPAASIRQLWTGMMSHLLDEPAFAFSEWPIDVRPAYSRTDQLPDTARIHSIRRGVDWFWKGHFFVHPSWESHWLKYQGDGTEPFGPPLPEDAPNGDGSMGILEGHASIIREDGSQDYRYWMRADVQGEAAMALAAAGSVLDNDRYSQYATNLIDYVFSTSNMRAGEKANPQSAAYGHIGWSTTHPGVFYGDDNARAILGMIAASSYLNTDKWNQEITEAIMANFRTTGKQGFRGERLSEEDIIKNGWPYYHNRDLTYLQPHFESWMWACYLWLYAHTGYEPLLTRTKAAISATMKAYPEQWLWGSSMQTQRVRMLLPLAWLVRVADTDEHREWLDHMFQEVLRYQDESGALQEEIGKGKGHFRMLTKNEDYGTDESSLIFKNGEDIACMLYTCNFVVFGMNEAAKATGNERYAEATAKLADFLLRIQVKSDRHPDLDGAWFRAFDYSRWDYWASNSDWGWGAWCTLTGWIQSWIVTTQAQLERDESLWDIAQRPAVSDNGKAIIDQMMRQ